MPAIDTNGAMPSDTRSSIEAAAAAFDAEISGKPQENDEDDEAPQDDKPADREEDTEDEESEEETEQDEGEESQESEDEESEDESDEDEEDEGEEDEDPVYAVTVDGQEIEVPLSELVRGYSRTADYTRKTQALAQERQQFQGEVQQTRALRTQYAQGLQQLGAVLQQHMPQEPNWAELRRTDPIEFAAAWAEHQQRQEQMRLVNAQHQALMQRQAEEQEQETLQARAQAREWLTRNIPEWADPEKAKADRAAIKAFAMKQGFTAEELKEIDDPRAILILRKAMLAERAQEKAKKVVPVKKSAAKKAPVLKPGVSKAPVTTRKTSDLTRKKQRLAKTGSVKDAAAYFESIL